MIDLIRPKAPISANKASDETVLKNNGVRERIAISPNNWRVTCQSCYIRERPDYAFEKDTVVFQNFPSCFNIGG